MDSKIVKDARLADLILRTETVVAAVQDIPGADIDSANATIELSNFGEDAEVVIAKCAGEIATVTVSGTVATLDFTSAVTAASIVEVTVKLKI